MLRLQINIHKAKLSNECVLFFGTGSGFGKEEIKAMLRDGDHPNWRDESFSDYLGKTFEQDDWNAAFWCFEVIGSTLQRLEEELRRFASAVPQQVLILPLRFPLPNELTTIGPGRGDSGINKIFNQGNLQEEGISHVHRTRLDDEESRT